MRAPESETSFFEPGTYWRREDARKVAFLIDGETYFAALAEAFRRARRSIFILAWDIGAKVELEKGDTPTRLGELLAELVRAHPELTVRVLVWDSPLVYAPGRESPFLNGEWETSDRLVVHRDDVHPVGASHHQKIIVVDEDLAFSGGFDVCHGRWDTCEHLADDPRRRDLAGDPYSPFHDVQMMVQGPVAASLAELARERWRRATGESLEAAPPRSDLEWPARVPVDLENVPVAISRTFPAFAEGPEVREIEAQTKLALRRARSLVYIENQFLTSKSIGQALLASLREGQGPQIACVLPERSASVLEESTTGGLQFRLLKKLRRADRHGRFGAYFPAAPNLGKERIIVHSKVLVVDDEFLRIGSANLNNRSMGLDTECDLSLAAEGREDVRAAIRAFRARLLGEHLGMRPETVESELDAARPLHGLIRLRAEHPRTLRPLKKRPSLFLRWMTWAKPIFDPDRATAREQLVSDWFRIERALPRPRFRVGSLLLAAFFATLALLWEWRPPTLAPLRLLPFAETLPYAALLFGVGGFFMATPLLLLGAAIFLWGPERGLVFGWPGLVAACLIQYGIGMFFSFERIRASLRGRRPKLFVGILRARVLPRGLRRALSMAPLTILNLVSGATRMPIVPFMLYSACSTLSIVGAFVLLQIATEALYAQGGRERASILLFSLAGILALRGLTPGKERRA